MRSEMLVINHFGMDIKNVLFERKKIKKSQGISSLTPDNKFYADFSRSLNSGMPCFRK